MLSRAALGLSRQAVPSLLSCSRTALQPPRFTIQNQIIRNFRDVRGRGVNTRRIIDVKPLRETTQALKRKVGPMEVGQIIASGGAVVGLGALCFYGLGLSNEPGAIDRAIAWPEHVRARIRETYLYLGASVVTTGASAVMVFRSPLGHKFFAYCQRHPILSTIGIMAAVIGTGQAMMSVPYSPGVGTKQLLWLVNCGILGLAVAPVGALGGAIAMRAAWYTAGIVGGLSTVAACAPSDKFLNWAGPLGIGFGAVFVASLGTMFVPATSTLGLSLYSISLYGGLLLFSGFLLYNTQKTIRKAESHPVANSWMINQGYNIPPFDPINASHRIFMDVLNIFIRIAQILAMGGGRRN